MKTVRLTQYIADHDLKVKANHIEKWLSKGEDRVKVEVSMKGRGNTHPELSIAVLDRLVQMIEEFATMTDALRAGHTFNAVITRKKK